MHVNPGDSGETPLGFGGGEGVELWWHVFVSQFRRKHMFLTCRVGFGVGLTFYGLLFNMFLCCFWTFLGFGCKYCRAWSSLDVNPYNNTIDGEKKCNDIIYKLSDIRISKVSWMGFYITAMHMDHFHMWPTWYGSQQLSFYLDKFVHNSLEQCPLVDARCGVQSHQTNSNEKFGWSSGKFCQKPNWSNPIKFTGHLWSSEHVFLVIVWMEFSRLKKSEMGWLKTFY